MVNLDVFECIDFMADRGGVWCRAGIINENEDFLLEAHYRSTVRHITALDRVVYEARVVEQCELLFDTLVASDVQGWEGVVYALQVQGFGLPGLQVRLAPVPKNVYWTVQ